MFFTAEDYLAMAFYESAPIYRKYAKIAANKLGEIGKIVIKGLKENAEDEWRTARSEGGAIWGETEWVKNYLKSLEVDPNNKSLSQNIQALLKSQPNDAVLRIFYATLKHPATKVAVTVGSELAKKYSTNSTEVQLRELLKNASKEELHQVISDPTFTPQVIAFTSAELTERNSQEIVRLKGSYSEQQVKELRESIDAEMRRRKANPNFDPQSPFEIQTSDPDLRDSLKNFNEFMQNSKREKDRIAYYNSFNFLINVGQATGCRELAMLGTVGTMGIQLHAAITTLSALPAGASFGLMLSPITAIAGEGTIDGEISHQYKAYFIVGSNFALTQATVVLSSHQYSATAMYLAKEGMKGIERMLGSSRLLEPMFQPTITSSSSASSAWSLSSLNSEDSRQQATVFFSNPFSSAEEVTVTNGDAEVIETTEPRQKQHRLN